MTNTQRPIDDNEEKPLDPAVERVRQKMTRLMVVSIGIMLIGLFAVLFAIIYKVTARDGNPQTGVASEPFEYELALPSGSRVVSHQLAGNRLTILAEEKSGNQSIIVFDLAEQRLLGRVNMTAR